MMMNPLFFVITKLLTSVCLTSTQLQNALEKKERRKNVAAKLKWISSLPLFLTTTYTHTFSAEREIYRSDTAA
jgi:hypothetical protein